MTAELLTEHQLEFLSLKGGCIGSSESTLGKMQHCWKSRVAAQILIPFILINGYSIQIDNTIRMALGCPL